MTGTDLAGTGRDPAAPRPSDVVGVPFLPPGGVSMGTNRVRAAVGRLHRSLAPPPVLVLEALFGLLDHRVLVALCEAGVPEALTRRTTVDDLATRTGTDPVLLERLLRFAATRGWVRMDRRGRVRSTRVTAFLRSDHPGGWRSWVDFAGGADVTRAVEALSARRTDAPFATVHGVPFFEWTAAHPERGAAFDGAMAAGARMHALGLSAALDWSTVRSVCDVGGGTGALLAALLELQPHLSGTVLDLPEVVARASHHPRLTALPGDAFAAVPSGFDTYLFVNVLHDWGDADAVRLLTRAREAASAPGRDHDHVEGQGGVDDVGRRAGGAAEATRSPRIVVVDSDRPTVPLPDVSVATDVLMAALTDGGRERDTEAFAALGTAAGLRHERSVRLASADLAHVFRLP